MRKFVHLAQLSDEELRTCLFYVKDMMKDLQRVLKEREDKGVQAEFRHQQRVLRELVKHAALRQNM